MRSKHKFTLDMQGVWILINNAFYGIFFLPPLAVCNPYSPAIMRVIPTLLRASCTSEFLPTFSQAATVPSPRHVVVRGTEKEGNRTSGSRWALSFPVLIPKCASVPQPGTLGGPYSAPWHRSWHLGAESTVFRSSACRLCPSMWGEGLCRERSLGHGLQDSVPCR